MNLQSFQNGQAILEHLNRDELDVAYQKAKVMVQDKPKNALMHYALGLCYLKRDDKVLASEQFITTLQLDPSFVSAAENLVDLNKDAYSLGELKYLYTLITSHKKGTEEMYRFLDQFSSSIINPNLSTGKNKLSQKIDFTSGKPTSTEEDNVYIKHLITQMDKYDKDAPIPDGETCVVPEPITKPFYEPTPPELQVEESKTENTKVEEPKVGESKVEESKVEESTTEEPTTEKPTIEEPIIEEPIIEESVKDEGQVGKTQTPTPAKPEPKTPKPKAETKSYGIETLTMAKLYVRQGLYEQAMGILLKLMKRKPEDEDIQIEIDNLQVLMREKR